ncbi:MAG: DNA-directed RNA polymerase subunit omega [Clostridiaceae bacterium]|nr:DNA-directed RNA polymerase subunit omega [Clostridiaceae bacterium]
MIYPPLTSLLEKVDSRYTLVIATAKRARMLTNGAKKLTDNPSTKDVTIAIEEIAEGKISYHKLQKKANQNIPEDAGHEPEPLESETDQDSE